MPLDARLRGLSSALGSREVSNASLASRFGVAEAAIAASSGVSRRFYAQVGEGPSALAAPVARASLTDSGIVVDDVSLIIFATMTPDVTFPGAACYLQEKLGAPTVGALDVRGQSAGFLCALDLALAFAEDARYRHVLVAAGEVFSSGLDESPAGVEMSPRFGDGAAVALVSRTGDGEVSGAGLAVAALHWETDGSFAERFWCEYPASRQYPLRLTAENLRQGLHFPRGDLAALAPVVEERLAGAMREAARRAGIATSAVAAAVVDWVDPPVARAAARAAGIPEDRVRVPTAEFGHVGAAGLPIGLDRIRRDLRTGDRVIAAAAGSGLSLGAAVFVA